MINFDNIDRHSRLYAFLAPLIKSGFRSFYRSVTIVGEEHIPSKGVPCIVIANHQNGLMDPMTQLLLFKDGRQPVFIARGDIFKCDFIARLLRFLKILPTFRTRDGDRNDVRRNNDIFLLAGEILKKGGTLTMYPEAQHQHGRYLGPFKKGFPRICFTAVELSDYQLDLQVLPITIHYSTYEYRGGDLLAVVGEPITFRELYPAYQEEPNHAYQLLNDKVRTHLQRMMIDISDREHYRELDMLRLMVSEERLDKRDKNDFYQRFIEEKRVIDRLMALKDENEAEYLKIIEETRNYCDLLDQEEFGDRELANPQTWGRALWKDFLLTLSIPLFLFGLVHHFIPIWLTEWVTKKIKDRQLKSSIRFALPLLLSPLWYLILFLILIFSLKSLFFTILWLIAAAISYKILFYWLIGVKKLFKSYFYLLQRKSDQVTQLQKLRKRIIDMIQSLL